MYNVWSWLASELGDRAYSGERKSCNRVVEIFTAFTTDDTKDRVLTEFREGKLRVVVATVTCWAWCKQFNILGTFVLAHKFINVIIINHSLYKR